ncbi:MAG: 4Fe-4S dicluster domain-containing protein [Blastocatellia bacterium]|nr:4Fe-4S dicluster domain-containing protein [Blastocatellia bacterium]MCS7158088.1 4Fe-4S dicluster domain-containing protein [Blastocatellia bacterium]MCX7753049.1 4Fe-4S dicluster domain-containing protein [Blastocatellia bacterium]MDW8168572.1 4Fe-4S dicluster domain-containing protein [Acidobacteriota bacterium]MDW8257265.1 4Fe-4S dicluster domain-containing protein [Acidobacteriota bacterium]
MPEARIFETILLERQHVDLLLEALAHKGYRLVGPTVRDGAIVYEELTSAADLPIGWTDEQDGGSYRLKKRNDQALFGYVVGPHSWKKFLFPPTLKLFTARRTEGGFEIISDEAVPSSAFRDPQPSRPNPQSEGSSSVPHPPKFAFIGVRSCELHAIAIQDKVFLGGAYVDPTYKERRENAFIVAVNCGQAGGTCFCVSMNTGPKATFGFDLALTEIIEPERHYFVVEVGTDRGAEILQELPHRPAREEEMRLAQQIIARTAMQMGRTLDTTDIKDLLYRNYEHPRWDQVAARCLTCANCTMVCPTCFCSTVEDVTDLSGEHAERWRKWDSCFTMDFSYIHGGSVRASAKARYRQWLTHKLATWIDQFGTSGCVGCGRCITWCPVGIDITEEVRAIRASELIRTGESKRREDAHGDA